jgi:hypothetical protein
MRNFIKKALVYSLFVKGEATTKAKTKRASLLFGLLVTVKDSVVIAICV